MAGPYVPYILGIFSNPPPGSGYLQYLNKERDELGKAMKAFQEKKQALPYYSLNDSSDNKLDSGEVARGIADLSENLTVVHYSGHADIGHLEFNIEAVRAENFVTHLGDCKKIKLVVLNGCSTKGFVKSLLERTYVRAVIATDNPVEDAKAATFSIKFYERLLEKDSIAEAFTSALSVALPKTFKYDENIYKANFKDSKIDEYDLLFDKAREGKTRGLKTKIQVTPGDENERAAWGLYARANDILDWNLFEEATEPEKRAQEIRQSIKKLELELGILASELSDANEILGLRKDAFEKDQSEERRTKYENQQSKVNNLENRIKEKEQELNQLDDEKSGLDRDVDVNDRLQNFGSTLVSLNYTSQDTLATGLRKKGKIGPFSCFVLHGDIKSCLPLLSQRLLQSLKFSGVNKVIFDSGSVNLNFWDSLQEKVFGAIVGNNPDEIVNKMAALKRDKIDKQKSHLLLVFRHQKQEPESVSSFNRMVFTFWKDFVTSFQKVDAEKNPYTNGVYAFIVDDFCEVAQVDKVFTSSREKEYLEYFGKDEIVKPTFCLLPAVSNLKEDEVSNWVDAYAPRDYVVEESEIATILAKTNGALLDTIEELSVIGITDEISRLRVTRGIREKIIKSL